MASVSDNWALRVVVLATFCPPVDDIHDGCWRYLSAHFLEHWGAHLELININVSEPINLRDMGSAIHPILIVKVTIDSNLLENRDLIYFLRFLNFWQVLFRHWLGIHITPPKVFCWVHFFTNFLSLFDFIDNCFHINLSLIPPILSTWDLQLFYIDSDLVFLFQDSLPLSQSLFDTVFGCMLVFALTAKNINSLPQGFHARFAPHFRILAFYANMAA